MGLVGCRLVTVAWCKVGTDGELTVGTGDRIAKCIIWQSSNTREEGEHRENPFFDQPKNGSFCFIGGHLQCLR